MEPERKAKLIAEKRLRRGTVDVIHINEGDSVELRGQEVISEIDFAKVPNYADVVPALKAKPFFVPWLYSGVTIVYNKDKVPNPPTSYAELWDKAWAGRIGLTNQLYFNYIMMAGLIRGASRTLPQRRPTKNAEMSQTQVQTSTSSIQSTPSGCQRKATK